MTLWQTIDPPVWNRAGGTASNTELYDRAHRAALYVENVNSRVEAWEAVYDRQIDELATLTGTRLENPFRERSPDLPLEITIPGGIQRMQPGAVLGEMQALQASASARARYASALAQLRADNPQLVKFTDIDEEAVNSFIRGTEHEFVEAFQGRIDRPGTDFGALGITLGAGLLGMLRDPVQAPLFLLGAGPGAARTVAGRILAVAGREAVIGGVSEAALQPFIQRNRAIAGLPHGFRYALANIAFATAGGGVFGGSMRGVGEAFTAARGMIRPRVAAVPGAAPQRAAETVEAPPEVRGALDALENEVVFAAARPGAVDPDAHDRAMSAAIRAAEDPAHLAAARAEIDRGIGDIAFAYEMRRAIDGALIEMDMAAARAAPARTADAVGTIEAAPETQTVRAAEAIQEAPQAGTAARAVPQPEAGQPSPARPVAPPKRAANIIDFLIEAGGLRPHADLAAIGADALFRPGKGKLVRKAGTKGALDLDYAREAAAEAGYFGGDTAAAMSRTTPTDLLDLLDDAIRGKDAIPDTTDALSRSAEANVAAGHAAYLDRVEGEITAYMQAAEIDDRRWLRHAVQIAEQSGMGPNLTDSQIDDIMERAAILMAPAQTRRAIRDDIPFDTDTQGQPARGPAARRGQGRRDRGQAERTAVPDAGRDQGPPTPELARRPSDTFEDADAVAQADALERQFNGTTGKGQTAGEAARDGGRPSPDSPGTSAQAGRSPTAETEARGVASGRPGVVERSGVAFRDTRGAGVQYHGSADPNVRPSNDHYSSKNYYGQAFYTTDAVDVGTGYAKKGGSLYRVDETRPLRLYDGEEPVEGDLLAVIRPAEDTTLTSDGVLLDAIEGRELHGEPPAASLRELYDRIRDNGNAEGLSADSIQDIYDTINRALVDLGYDGFSHVGGRLTGAPAHKVILYFNPEQDVRLTKVNAEEFRAQEGTRVREADAGLELEDGTTLRAALAAATHTKFVSSLVEACRLR